LHKAGVFVIVFKDTSSEGAINGRQTQGKMA
jgi:hypothetical protein